MDKKKTILVVDDVRVNTILLKQMLAATPYEVVTVGSGAEALDVVKNGQVDLVLLDIMMPVMNGYEVLTAIRSNPETKDIPVVIASALSGRHDEDLARSKGANDYLTKPINNTELLNIVKKYLE